MNNTLALTNKTMSVKKQTIATFAAIAAAVALPQICHIVGFASGLGSKIGEVLLPMHIAIILVGLIAGPYAGAIAGLASPLLSYALTGMPALPMLPYMTIELCTYGLTAGLLANVKLNSVIKVLAVQIIGRGVRAIAILVGHYAFDSVIVPNVIYTSICVGLIGIILQLILIPLVHEKIKQMIL